MIDVNLLPPQNVLSQKEKQIRKYLILAVAIFGGVVLFTEGIFFGVDTYVSSQTAALTKKRDDLLATFNANSELANNFRMVTDKIVGIRQTQKLQTNFGLLIGEVASLIADDASLRTLTMETTGKVNLNGFSPNFPAFSHLMDQLVTESTAATFSAITISGIREEKNGVTFSLEMKYAFKN